ncbi:unnamed protein product [Mesocestoides corti]|uniref:Uncharacterized protein n=1 Tax=Mesocestoides corti TaxID=53468 RepID=A0A3P6HSD7_MESCO|nr:unnamed protein product [Mesocestoides corti]
MDHDRFSGPDLVGEYRTTLTPSSLLSHQTLDSGEVRSHHRELPGTVMKIDASKVCKPDHYGRECKFCQVSSERGYCTAVGDEVCISVADGRVRIVRSKWTPANGKSCFLDDPLVKTTASVSVGSTDENLHASVKMGGKERDVRRPSQRMLFRRGNAVEMQVVKSDYHNDLSRANNLYEELEGPAMTVQKPDKYFDEYESVSNSFYASQTCIASMQQPPLRDPPVVTANDGHKFHSSSDKESLSEIYTSLKSVTIPTPHETNEEDYETIIKKESTFGSRNTADNSGVFISQGIEDRGHSKCTGENIQDVERSPSNESGNADYDDCDVYEFIDNGVLNNNE